MVKRKQLTGKIIKIVVFVILIRVCPNISSYVLRSVSSSFFSDYVRIRWICQLPDLPAGYEEQEGLPQGSAGGNVK